MTTIRPELVAAILGMAVVTFLIRVGPLLLLGRSRLQGGRLAAALRLAAPAVLGGMAIVAVTVVEPADGAARPVFHAGVELVAVLVAAIVAATRRNLILGLVAAIVLVTVARHIGVG